MLLMKISLFNFIQIIILWFAAPEVGLNTELFIEKLIQLINEFQKMINVYVK